MNIKYYKYHALLNDFIIIEDVRISLSRSKLSRLAQEMCNRRSGVGADGILYLTAEGTCDRQIGIINADGSWAEKSGNGLRIVTLHQFLKDRRRRRFSFLMNGQPHKATVLKAVSNSALVRTELGCPRFEASSVPVKTRHKYMINAPLKLGGLEFPVTCLSMGNPHTVLLVDDFDFDWKQFGIEIECHRAFPNDTNVEFVKVKNRGKIQIADWERGAGATGSSGTGAAAAVCACVMMGLVNRECEVVFEKGSLFIHWDEISNIIELTGPVDYVTQGEFVLK
ncbi:MAG: diaminopimelate epimerase [candidate division Zixibacteria bacterium]|nr:diaminopimelate epimerase [candidate division Zixibacteria bacterium]